MTEAPPPPDDSEAARVHEAVADAEADLAEHARLTQRRERLAPLVQEAERELDRQTAALGLQSAELRKLETFSPTRIWAALRGNHATELERERAEQDAQEYVVAVAEAKLTTLRQELMAVEHSRDALGDVQERLARALAAKEAWIVAGGRGPAQELSETARALGAARATAKEVQEALTAADRALAALVAAEQALGSAGSWSTYDTFFGGGLITDMVKYDRIDTAEQHMRGADTAMRALSRELADVGLSGVGGVEVTDMTRLFDVWFDNIFSDWSVRSRISEAASRIASARGPVADVRQLLQARAGELGAELARLDRRRSDLLAQA